ncbi:hypothetical protein J6590_001654 [Homalodisca vitripennis]|nr:hypothetical protein J6590_001654 [Homalodisca vitripennis]
MVHAGSSSTGESMWIFLVFILRSIVLIQKLLIHTLLISVSQQHRRVHVDISSVHSEIDSFDTETTHPHTTDICVPAAPESPCGFLVFILRSIVLIQKLLIHTLLISVSQQHRRVHVDISSVHSEIDSFDTETTHPHTTDICVPAAPESPCGYF